MTQTLNQNVMNSMTLTQTNHTNQITQKLKQTLPTPTKTKHEKEEKEKKSSSKRSKHKEESKPKQSEEDKKAKKKKRRFTEEETKNLIEGFEKFCVGHWKNILNAYNFNDRSCVDLKDKWRNIENSRMRTTKQKPTSSITQSLQVSKDNPPPPSI